RRSVFMLFPPQVGQFCKLSFASGPHLCVGWTSEVIGIAIRWRVSRAHPVLLIPLCPAGSPHRYSPVNHPDGRSAARKRIMPSLHDKTIIIDGLIVSNFGPEIFRAMRAGGITAANCTCSIWEDFPT